MIHSNLSPELVDKFTINQDCLSTFRKRFKQHHFLLACHAAFPLAVTPDLLYCIWANFQCDIHGRPLNIPWITVSDLLLSGLFEEVGYGLYELEMKVRDELLQCLQCDTRFSSKRFEELSNFLLAYVDYQIENSDADDQDFAQAQRWTALAYIQPEKVANELAFALSEAYQSDEFELIRVTSLIKTLAKPLAEAGFESLLTYAWGMKELLYKKLKNIFGGFDGLINLNKDPHEVRAQFLRLLDGEDFVSVVEFTEDNNYFKEYTSDALQVISTARKEARKSRHNFVGSEHILLGLIQDKDVTHGKIFTSLGLTLNTLKIELERFSNTKLRPLYLMKSYLPGDKAFTQCVKRVLAFSKEEARQLSHEYVNTEHLLLGLIREGENLACVLLEKFDIDPLEVRNQVISSLIAEEPFIRYIPQTTSTREVDSKPYSEQSLKVLEFARSESMSLRHGFLSTEKILIGLLRHTDIAVILQSFLATTYEAVRAEAEKIANPKLDADSKMMALLTPRARRALEFSQQEAHKSENDYVHTSHVLLGLIRESDNLACTILANLDVDTLSILSKISLLNYLTVNSHDLFKYYTEKAIKIIILAAEEAQFFGHSLIGDEHMLLGFLGEGNNIASSILGTAGANIKTIRKAVKETVDHESALFSGKLPFTTNAKLILELSLEAAQEFDHDYVDEGHILLSLLRKTEAASIQILKNLNIDCSAIFSQVFQVLVSSSKNEQYTELGKQYGESNKQYGELVVAYQQAITQNPADSCYLYTQLGNTHFFQGQHEEAIKAYEKAISFESFYAYSHCNLGYVHLTQGKYEEAILYFRRTLKLRDSFEPPVSAHTDAYIGLGKLYSAQENYEEAIINFQKAITLNPRYLTAYNERGHVYFAQGKYEKASSDYRKAITLNPYDTNLYANLSDTYLYQGKYEDAVVIDEQALALSPYDAILHANLGNTYLYQGKYEKAVIAHKQAITLNPHNAALYANLGNTYFYQGKHEEAVIVHKQAITLNPHNAALYANLGNIYFYQSKYEEAAFVYKQAIELNPGEAHYHSGLGFAYLFQSQHERATSAFQKAISLNPKLHNPYSGLGFLYLIQGKNEDAIIAYQKAIDFCPSNDSNNDLYLFRKFMAYQVLNQTEKARKSLAEATLLVQEICEENSKDFQSAFKLALYHLAAGKVEQAESIYRQAQSDNIAKGHIRVAIRDLDSFLTIFSNHLQAQSMRELLQQALDQITLIE